jgi:hypothetical protein
MRQVRGVRRVPAVRGRRPLSRPSPGSYGARLRVLAQGARPRPSPPMTGTAALVRPPMAGRRPSPPRVAGPRRPRRGAPRANAFDENCVKRKGSRGPPGPKPAEGGCDPCTREPLPPRVREGTLTGERSRPEWSREPFRLRRSGMAGAIPGGGFRAWRGDAKGNAGKAFAFRSSGRARAGSVAAGQRGGLRRLPGQRAGSGPKPHRERLKPRSFGLPLCLNRGPGVL